MARNQYVPTIIVDRNALFRIGLIHTLAQTRFRVTAEYSSFNEIPAGSIPSTVCLFLIGIDDLIHQDIGAFREIKAKNDSIHVALLGNSTDKREIDAVMQFYGEFYMIKNAVVPDMLLQSLELMMAGQAVFTHDFIRILREEWLSSETTATAPSAPPPLTLDTSWEVQRVISHIGDAPGTCRLSERETAILMRLMHGAANKVIARELDIAEATVKVHVKSVLRKIRVKNRTQAATWAWAHCSGQPAPSEPSPDEIGVGIRTGLGLEPVAVVQPDNVNAIKAAKGAGQPAPPGLAVGFAGG